MDTAAEALMALLPEPDGGWPEPPPGGLREIRLRAGQPVCLVSGGGEAMSARRVDAAWIERAADALAAHSLYACGEELRAGYLPLPDGCRAGVCGRFAAERGRVERLTAIRSICVRVARAELGCADGLMPHLYERGRPLSALILSAPGLGKTTLLRDVIRQFSGGTAWGRGVNVGVADERRELGGGGRLDLGPRTDVAESCPRAEAIAMLVRAMAPAVVATDELGGADEAAAVMEAARCGVRLAATAHAGDLDDARRREALRRLLDEGVFDRIVVLAGRPGRVDGVFDGAGRRLSAGEDGA